MIILSEGVIITKGKISFTMDDELIENFRIIAIKKKVSASSLAEKCIKKCVEENKELL